MPHKAIRKARETVAKKKQAVRERREQAKEKRDELTQRAKTTAARAKRTVQKPRTGVAEEARLTGTELRKLAQETGEPIAAVAKAAKQRGVALDRSAKQLLDEVSDQGSAAQDTLREVGEAVEGAGDDLSALDRRLNEEFGGTDGNDVFNGADLEADLEIVEGGDETGGLDVVPGDPAGRVEDPDVDAVSDMDLDVVDRGGGR